MLDRYFVHTKVPSERKEKENGRGWVERSQSRGSKGEWHSVEGGGCACLTLTSNICPLSFLLSFFLSFFLSYLVEKIIRCCRETRIHTRIRYESTRRG